MDYMKDEPDFIGVFAHDELPEITNEKKYSMIINYNNHDESGSHWVCICNNTFFDSFGVVPSTIIQKFIRRNNGGKEIPYNSHQLQNELSVLCGYWCIVYIKMINKGYSQYDATHKLFSLTNTIHNEETLRRLIMKYL